MKMFRIKHKPTGLYFRPLPGKYSNLDSTGKIYSTNGVYNLLTNPELDFHIRDIYFSASRGRSKKKMSPEYEMGMKIHNGEIPGVDVKYDSTRSDDYMSFTIANHPEDWEKEYVEVKVTVIDGKD